MISALMALDPTHRTLEHAGATPINRTEESWWTPLA